MLIFDGYCGVLSALDRLYVFRGCVPVRTERSRNGLSTDDGVVGPEGLSV
jgi:hypothetical protein